MNVHFCHTCSAEYIYGAGDVVLVSMHLYVRVNDKMYRWTTYPDRKFSAGLWYVEEPGEPGVRPNKGLVLLKSLENYSDLTPQNIEEKIRVYLPFL